MAVEQAGQRIADRALPERLDLAVQARGQIGAGAAQHHAGGHADQEVEGEGALVGRRRVEEPPEHHDHRRTADHQCGPGDMRPHQQGQAGGRQQQEAGQRQQRRTLPALHRHQQAGQQQGHETRAEPDAAPQRHQVAVRRRQRQQPQGGGALPHQRRAQLFEGQHRHAQRFEHRQGQQQVRQRPVQQLDLAALLFAAFVRRQPGQVALEHMVESVLQADEQRVQHRGSRSRGACAGSAAGGRARQRVTGGG